MLKVKSKRNIEVVENFPHHKENEGGNKEFDPIYISLANILNVSNRKEIYQIHTMTELVKLNKFLIT